MSRRPALAVSALGIAAFVALALSACAPSRSVAPAAPAAPEPTAPSAPLPEPISAGPVKIALLGPIGAADPGAAATGTALANAARMALDGPAAGLVELRVYDTGGDPARAAASARQAVADGARLILGPLFGANTPAVAEVAAAAGLKVISFSTDSALAGDPVYVSGYLPEMEAERILDYAARQGLTTVGVFAPQVPYGDAALRGAESAAPRTGAFIATRMTYPRSFQDIQETAPEFARAARESGVQAVLLPDYGDGLKIAASFLDFNGLAPGQVQYLGLGQWEARATLTEPALRGGWFAGADPDAVQAFATEYAARYGSTPPFVAVLGHDAVRIAAELVAEARATGAPDPFSAGALTRPGGFDGVLGPVRFEPDGRARRGLAVLAVGASGFEVLEPAPFAFGAAF